MQMPPDKIGISIPSEEQKKTHRTHYMPQIPDIPQMLCFVSDGHRHLELTRAYYMAGNRKTCTPKSRRGLGPLLSAAAAVWPELVNTFHTYPPSNPHSSRNYQHLIGKVHRVLVKNRHCSYRGPQVSSQNTHQVA